MSDEKESKDLVTNETPGKELTPQEEKQIMMANIEASTKAIQVLSENMIAMNETIKKMTFEVADMKRIMEEGDYEKQGYDGSGMT